MSLPRPEDASRQQIQHVLGAFWSEWPGEDIATVYTGTQVSATASFIKRFALCDSFYSSKLAYTEEDDLELRVRCPGRGNIVEVAMLAYALIHNCEPDEIPVGRDHGNSVAWPERSSNLAAKQD